MVYLAKSDEILQLLQTALDIVKCRTLHVLVFFVGQIYGQYVILFTLGFEFDWVFDGFPFYD